MMKARLLSPLAALLIGLLSTLAAAVLVSKAESERERSQFEAQASAAVSAVESRMLSHLTLLRGAAGLFNASDEVTAEDFRAYIARLRLDEFFPGVLGVGYSAYLPSRADVERFVAARRREGSSNFRVWPDGARQDYSSIRYIEPLHRRNQQALGFDMLSEPTRRSAMETARTSGMAVMSGRVQLVQEIGPVKQPGFLIYVPLYRGQEGLPNRTDVSRHYGWIYSPLRSHDLFSAIFAERALTDIVVEIYDQQAEERHLLYRSGERTAQTPYEVTRPLTTAGRTWIVRVAAQEGFGSGSNEAVTVVVAGALLSFLLAALVLQQSTQAARTEETVRLRTSELRLANDRLREEAQAREAAESKVRHMQKIEAIGQLTGGIAHDFNNMLSIILGNLDMAQRRIDDRSRVERAVANARIGAERAAELTRRLLAFGRRQALQPRVLDANKLVAGMSEMLHRTLGETVRLETVLAAGLWKTCADPGELENAILNLAINARDAMPGGGLLTIETANCYLDEAYALGNEGVTGGQYVLLAVSDTGAGMTPEVAERALDPFFTTKGVGRGTGLGLSQVFGFVKQSGGHLKLYSEPGQGTSVKLYLPRHRGTLAGEETATNKDAPVPRGNGETILVVEDEADVRAVTVEALTELGYRIIEAQDGAGAIEKLGPNVDLLFTDVVMPGMDGRQLANEARRRCPNLVIVFTTGYTRNAIVHHGRLDDDVQLLPKPFTIGQLAHKIREALDDGSAVRNS